MIAQELVSSFGRMVRADGGSLVVVSVEGDDIRLGYTPGEAPSCESGACILPHVELEEMMREWLGRRSPSATVSIQLVRKSDG